MQKLDSFIDRVTALPPAPRMLPELLHMLAQDETDAADIVRLITFDPSLTAQVLRRCNSAHYGFAAPAQHLQEAVVRIGLGGVYRVVARVVGERTLGAAQAGYGIAQGDLWKHSAVTAVAAQIIARKAGEDESAVFTAALLHDLGKLILSTSVEGVYSDLVNDPENTVQSFVEAEKDALGVEHAEIGGRLLARWNFPEHLVAAVWHHHDPARAESSVRMTACVHLGDIVAHTLGHGYGRGAYAVRFRREALELLGLSSTDLDAIIMQASLEADAILSPDTAPTAS